MVFGRFGAGIRFGCGLTWSYRKGNERGSSETWTVISGGDKTGCFGFHRWAKAHGVTDVWGSDGKDYVKISFYQYQ
jgi:hypothetical protein